MKLYIDPEYVQDVNKFYYWWGYTIPEEILILKLENKIIYKREDTTKVAEAYFIAHIEYVLEKQSIKYIPKNIVCKYLLKFINISSLKNPIRCSEKETIKQAIEVTSDYIIIKPDIITEEYTYTCSQNNS